MQCIVCHWNPIDVIVNMFPMGKIKVLWFITNIIVLYFKTFISWTCGSVYEVGVDVGEKSLRRWKSTKNNKKISFMINKFFGNQWPFNKADLSQHAFLEYLVL
jgi:hypothetical protein